MSIRAIIADDHQILREGLRSLLETKLKITVIGEADNGRDAVRMVGEHAPDIVIMDISMPDLNGVEATRRIREAMPDAKVIALSMHSDKRFVTQMLSAGASGYLLKDCAFEELERAIQTVLRREIYVSPGIAGIVIKDYLEHLTTSGARQEAHALTMKEREILQLIAEGKSTKEIAARLNLSVKTVETHRLHIMEKLEMRSVAELTKYAIREGLISLDE